MKFKGIKWFKEGTGLNERVRNLRRKKAYELELLLAKVTQRKLDKSGLSLKEFAKKTGMSLTDLKVDILPNLEDFNCGHELRVVAETFNKLGYDLKFILVEKEKNYGRKRENEEKKL